MNWIPLVIMFGLSMMYFGGVIEKQGQPKEGRYNVTTSIIALVIECGLILWAVGVIG
jgi:hypothetical protein